MAATLPLVAALDGESGGNDKKSTVTPSLLGRLRDLVTCRRRAPAGCGDSASSTAGYEGLRKRAEQLSEEQKAAFEQMAWWSEAETKMGAKVLVLAPRGPSTDTLIGDLECNIDMWSLLAYTVSQMHTHVIEQEKMYAVVWVQETNHRVWPLSARTFQQHLPERYSRLLDAVHVVHPSWTVRALRLALWPFASDEFWDQFQCHERIEFLEPFMSLRKLALPQDIYEYDKFLDKQAEEMSNEAIKQMNSRGIGGGLPERLSASTEKDSKYDERMEELQRVIDMKASDHDKKFH